MKRVLDEMQYQRGRGRAINQTNLRMRMKTLLSFGAGLRSGEIDKLVVADLLFDQELIAVRTKSKRSPMRYVPMPPELAEELQRYLRLRASPEHPMLFPHRPGAEEGKRQRVDRSFHKALRAAKIEDFRFHDLRHTFASWYMMKGGDLYEPTKILGHRNIKTTERCAKLARKHIARTGSTAREVWSMMDGDARANAAAA